MYTYETYAVEKRPEQKTAILYLNRPEKMNAMNWPFWRDLALVVDELEKDPEVEAVVVAGKGRAFSVGIDIFGFASEFLETISAATPANREDFRRLILQMQQGFNRMHSGDNVYIAAIHHYCLGGGLDLAAACDIRLASRDAVISLREARVAIVADMGSLNRLPRIIGQGNARLMAFTARDFTAAECLRMGLLSEIFDTPEAVLEGALNLAAEITANARSAVRGSKRLLNFMENHSVEEGLDYVALWNSSFFSIQEVQEAAMKSAGRGKKAG
jgi:enoyl-CoA hydratase